MCHFNLYKPGTLVYFLHEDGIKRGKVISITTQRHEQGEFSQWQVLTKNEQNSADGKILHNVQLNHLALDLHNLEEPAKQTIKSFKAWEGDK